MVRIDKIPPVTTSNAEDGWHDTFNLFLTSEDNLSGTYATYYSVNGEDFRVGEVVVLTKKGEHTVTYYSMGRAGNKESVQTVQMKINGLPEQRMRWKSQSLQVQD